MPNILVVTNAAVNRVVKINFANVLSYFAHDKKLDTPPDRKGAKPVHAWVVLVTGEQVPVTDTVEQIDKKIANFT
jgi:hypothetical protein